MIKIMETNDTIENHRQGIMRLMESRGITMYKMAKMADISDNTLRNYLVTKTTDSLTVITAAKIAASQGVTVSELIGEVPSPASVDMELFARCVNMVDSIISERTLELSTSDRVRLYFAWYEMKIYMDDPTAQHGKFFSLVSILR